MKQYEYQYYFEKLDVWQKARIYVKQTYQITNQFFPAEERFGLISQLQRCTVSVASNIAEGVSRKTTKDKLRFLEIAYGSLMESLNQWYIAYDLEYIDIHTLEQLKIQIYELSNKLNALTRSITDKK